uniref:ATP synthase F0 subunit 8 n=1 Tax=Tetraphleps aterrimus TaxID=452413 RepID=A0A4D6NZA4_9HEMI|nr:ATP synthase F0 subunit 8 [Tetraphleps aterrimus]QCE31838.1 ATP synthase F0 subunit 8 [Tetraphleps aterrimus]
MPQMAPMWWTMLYTIFITCFILTLIMTYFNIEIMPSTEKNKILKTKIKWMW